MGDNPKVHTEEFGEVRQKWADMIRDKGNENLAISIETTTASNLSDQKVIKAWKQLHPEFNTELETLRENILQLQKEGKEEVDPNKYFKPTSNGEKFVANWLAEDIEEDYTFKHLEDSGQLFVFQNGYFQPRGEQIVKSEVNRRLGDEFLKRRMNNVLEIIKTRCYTPRQEFRPPERMINFENGIYDLKEGRLVDHHPRYNFTYKIPVKYPEKPPESPNINRFLESIVETEEDVKTLKEIAGYLLLPDYPINKAFVLVGQGSNGKSRYIDLLKALIGEENYTNKSLHELEENRFATQKLYSNLACFDDDLPSHKIYQTNKIKKLTGGSDIGAEVKYGGQFDFKNYAKLVFATNEMPRTTDNSDGFFRRWIIIDFPYKFKNNPEGEHEKEAVPKSELMDSITSKEELQGFVWEVVEDLKEVLDNNEFTYSPTVDEARQKWREYSTPMIRFIEKYVKQGVTYSEAESQAEADDSISSYSYDYVRKDSLKKLIGDYCEGRSQSRPTKKDIKQALDESDLYFGVRRTRQEPEDKRIPVYSGLKLELQEEVSGVSRVLLDHKAQARACTCVECSRQSTDILDGSDNLTSLPGEILNLFSRHDDKLEYHEIMEEVGIEDQEHFQEVVEQMKKEGELWEPQPGYLSKT